MKKLFAVLGAALLIAGCGQNTNDPAQTDTGVQANTNTNMRAPDATVDTGAANTNAAPPAPGAGAPPPAETGATIEEPGNEGGAASVPPPADDSLSAPPQN